VFSQTDKGNTVPEASNGKTNLFYDVMGSSGDPTMLLIMGLNAQMTAFKDEFCDLFVDAGFYVIRFDNRDVGFSSKTEGEPPPLGELIQAQMMGTPLPDVPYLLSDMSKDAFAVLDAAGVEKAHVVGVSMGGMIAQTMVIEEPDRVLSLTSIMSTTGAPDAGTATPELMKSIPFSTPRSREEAISSSVETFRLISGPHFNEEEHTAQSIAAYDRDWNPNAQSFQIAAIFASGDRTESLRSVSMPSLIVHGHLDPLVQLSGGEATAAAIRGSKLVTYEEMGHDIPELLWPEITNEIINHAQAAAKA